MRKIHWLLLTALLILSLAGAGVAAWLRSPRLMEVYPAPESTDIPPYAPVRITFSRSTQPDSTLSRVSIQPERQGSFSWEANTLIFTPSQPWPSGTTITVQVKPGIRASQFLSLPVRQGKTWSFTTSQTLLAYLWPSTGKADLYALDPLTGDIQRLTQTQNILDYSLSQDGQWIYYSVEQTDGTAIWRQRHLKAGQTPSTDRPPKMLLECPGALCRFPQASPDGQWLAFERAPMISPDQPGNTSVWLLDLSDLTLQAASQTSQTSLHPGWSADGRLSFYVNERQGFVIQDIAGKELTFLPNQTGEAGSWQPSGGIFLTTELGSEITGSVGTFSSSRLIAYELPQPDSSGEVLLSDLTQAVNLQDAFPVFSPDGAWIAFARRYLDNERWTPGMQIWLMKADGSEAHALTQAGDYNHHDFAWSSDGKQLAYVRFNQTALTEPAELWLIQADGSQPVQLVKGGTAPRWLP